MIMADSRIRESCAGDVTSDDYGSLTIEWSFRTNTRGNYLYLVDHVCNVISIYDGSFVYTGRCCIVGDEGDMKWILVRSEGR